MASRAAVPLTIDPRPSALQSRILVDAVRRALRLDERIARFVHRNLEHHVTTVRRSRLEERSTRRDTIRRATILPNQSTVVAEPLTAAERPERFLAEEQRRRRVRVGRNRERRQ